MVATVKKSAERAVAGASQEVRVANMTAEGAVDEASQIKHVAVERSLKMQTPQLRRSL